MFLSLLPEWDSKLPANSVESHFWHQKEILSRISVYFAAKIQIMNCYKLSSFEY